VWPVVAIWGHPEDVIALALALYGLLSALKGHWTRSGWLWGLALVMQPLVVLALPVVFAIAPTRRWLRFAGQCVLPAAALLVIPLAQEWRATTTALLKQPNYPAVNHATPWLSLAPVLQKAHPVVTRRLGVTTIQGHEHFTVLRSHTISGEVVAAGPGRAIAILLSLAIGFWVYRSRPSAIQIVWAAALALSLRCFFEAVMDPFYLWPGMALILLLSVDRGSRLAIVSASAAFMTWWSYRYVGPWEWWAPIAALILVSLVSTYPAMGEPEIVPSRPQITAHDPEELRGLPLRVS